MTQLSITTNIPSLIAQNTFNKNTAGLEKAMNRLSTGLKINTAQDDPAGLAISERLNLEIVGNSQVLENIQTGISVLNIAEGNLTSINNDLARIRDLCVQAANDFYTTDSLNAIKEEIQSRLDNINQTAKSSEFNGLKLLDGSVEHLLIQIGFGSDESTNTVDIANNLQNCQTSAAGLDINLTASGIGIGEGLSLTPEKFVEYMTKIDDAMSKINSYTTGIGAQYNKLETTYDNLSLTIDNQTEAKSTLVDADIAQESSNYVKYQILQESSATLLAQANTLPQIALSLLQST